MKAYLFNVLYGFDLFVNALLRGSPRETLSARAYRMKLARQPYWAWLAGAIDALLGANHCKEAFEKEHK